ncbi:MAG: hypothetical protein NDI69_04655 [Bacteriovoracaceae bacterium]|nr:hypothetical protein [Bacteriovoracaceae bacterium]
MDFKSLNENEIYRLIVKASRFGGVVELPTLTSNRTFDIQNIDIDSMGMMRIELSEEFISEEERHIKVKLKYRKMYFHLMPQQFLVEGKTLVANLPKSAKALEIRDSDRYIMPFNTEITSTLHRIEKRGGTCDLNVQIFDVSNMGLGFILHNAEEETLLQNDHIWIKTINNQPLENSIFGRIVYVSNNKVGVSLDTPLPIEIFTELQHMSQVVLSA